MNRPTLRGRWLLAMLLTLVPLGPASAQAPRPSFDNNGTHVFRRLLHDRGFKALKSFEQIEDPTRTIVIALGNLDVLSRIPPSREGFFVNEQVLSKHFSEGGNLISFVMEGGAVLMASDRRPSNEGIREGIRVVTGVQIAKDTFICQEEGDRLRFRDMDFCPILQAIPRAKPNLFGGSDLLAGLDLRVATNLPSALQSAGERPNGVSVLASLPSECTPYGGTAAPRHNRAMARVLNFFGAGSLFAVGGEVDKGRVLFLADHSIFINEMMLPDDNNNLEFADNCLSWLRGDGEERNQVLFIEDGKVRGSFDVPLKAIDIDVNRLLVQIGHRLIQMGEQDAYNQDLLNRISPVRQIAQQRVFQAILLGLSLVLGGYLVFRVGVRARYHLQPALPRLERVHQTMPERAFLDQREQAMLATGNLGEAARALARQCFAILGCTPPAPESAGATAPSIEVAGNWWTRRRWTQSVRRLWHLAIAAEPAQVSARACRRLARDAEELHEAVNRGTVRLVGNPS